MGKWFGQGTKTWNWEVDWCLERNSGFECKYDRSYFGLGNEWKWWSHCLIDIIEKNMLVGSLNMILSGRSENTFV